MQERWNRSLKRSLNPYRGIGLLTEFVDAVDWAPAVLKAFRKVGALSRKFTDYVITAAKKSSKAKKLDSTLKVSFRNLRNLTNKMGLARTASIFKHVDDPADLASLATAAARNSDAVYFTMKSGGHSSLIHPAFLAYNFVWFKVLSMCFLTLSRTFSREAALPPDDSGDDVG
ncbi:MAG: hypothetical protein WC340_13470 [Kiritimatiellia bacterium]